MNPLVKNNFKNINTLATTAIVGLLTCVATIQSRAAEAASATSGLSNAVPMTLNQIVRKVIDYNETNQIRLLELAIANHRTGAEWGVFEPELVLSAEHVDSHRPNTEEQRRNLGLGSVIGSRTVFDERNNDYNAGVELLAPTGGKFRIGSTLRELSNNLDNTIGNEWVSTVGVSLTQPLLKGAGTVATMAGIRIAAISSDLAYQDYRKRLMEVVASTEAAYWDLYLMQEQYNLTTESMKLAETLVRDNTEKERQGTGTQLEVLEAQAGYSVRKSRQTEALQRLYEAMNRLAGLYAGGVIENKELIRATDRPPVYEAPESFYESWRQAFDLNPDYLSRRKQAVMEGVRVAYAKNQRLPQLDLKASYGLNGLGFTPESSFNDVNHGAYQAWTISGEMRIPLGGGLRAKHELAAARLKEKQALIGISDMEKQISLALDTSIRRLKSSKESVASYQQVADFSQQVLQTQLARLEVGKIDSRTVLETEQKGFEARLQVVDSLVQHQRAKLEWENTEGSILMHRNMELSKEEIDQRTRKLGEGGKLTDAEYKNFLRGMKDSYDNKSNVPRTPEGKPAPGMTPAEQERLQQILRDKMKEVK